MSAAIFVGAKAVQFYEHLRKSSQVMHFMAPKAELHDPKQACEFLRALANDMESHQKEVYPDGLPF